MCNPMLIMVGLSAVEYMSGKAQAEAQYDNTEKATEMQYEQIHDKQGQINDQAALDQSNRIRQGMEDRAKIATISGESGALGISSDRLLGNSFMQEGTDISTMEKNRQNAIKQTGWEQKQAQAGGAASNLNTAIKEPTLISTGLQIGADAYAINAKSTAEAKAKTGVKP